jgi:hypothetical protein
MNTVRLAIILAEPRRSVLICDPSKDKTEQREQRCPPRQQVSITAPRVGPGRTACPSTTMLAALGQHPCSSVVADQYTCTCKCCSTSTCPNYFEGFFPALLMSNVGSPDACTNRMCRFMYKEQCPVEGAGEVYSGSYLEVDCPPPPPPTLCASGNLEQSCDCTCCTNNECSSQQLRQLPVAEGTACGPEECAAAFSECTIGSTDQQARVVARLTELSPCKPAAPPPTLPPSPHGPPNLPRPSEDSNGLGAPVWLVVLPPLLCVLLLAVSAFSAYIIKRETRGNPVFHEIESIQPPRRPSQSNRAVEPIQSPPASSTTTEVEIGSAKSTAKSTTPRAGAAVAARSC